MRASAACVLLAVGALALAACGGEHAKPFRIGIVTDCYGQFDFVHDAAVASAEAPVLARHGKVAGRPVELLQGCATGDDELLPEARRLVEEEHADVLVGFLFPQGGLVLRRYARLRPQTTFLIQPGDAPELTLSDPAPNVFRFVADAAQGVAGLGRYAYKTLGWRTAETVADDLPYGWAAASGFAAEFCALGGKVVEPEWAPYGEDPVAVAGRIPSTVDGVFVGNVGSVFGFLKRYASRRGNLAKHVVATSTLVGDSLARGVVVASNLPFGSRAEALAFPYGDGVEAALEALAQTGGKGGRQLQEALAHLVLDSPSGRIRLDRNRQAIVPIYLGRIGAGRKVRTLRIVPDVEQTFGGYFTSESPPRGRTLPACVKRRPPPWAR